MIISQKEKTLLIVTIVFMLYAVVAFSLKKQLAVVRQIRSSQAEKTRLLASYKDLIASSNVWEEAYRERAAQMPVFETGRQVETYWLGLLDRLASTNNLSIIRRQALDERVLDNVYEMPIECKEWEGDLESLVHFLYDVHSQGAMLDVRRLFIRPNGGKNGGLRGSFTLYCAYMRLDELKEQD